MKIQTYEPQDITIKSNQKNLKLKVEYGMVIVYGIFIQNLDTFNGIMMFSN